MKLRCYLPAFFGSIVLSFVLYGNILPGEFVYDDNFFVVRAEDLARSQSLASVWLEPFLPLNIAAAAYRPLTVFSFALNFILTGESPFWFHFTSVLLNGLATFLVFLVLFKLFEDKLLALFTALIWSVLPVHTESVAWIKARDEILSTVFLLLSWIFFVKATEAKINYKTVFLSSLFFLLAVFSKELAIFGPVLFLSVYYLKEKPTLKTLAKLGLLFLPTLVFYLGLRWYVLGKYAFISEIVHFINNPLISESLPTRFFTAFKVVFIYISKTFVPLELSATYYYNHLGVVRNILSSWEAIFGLVFLLMLFFFVVSKKTRKTPLAIGSIIFFVSYFLFSKFIFQGGDILAERWMYFPTIGLSVIAGFGLTKLFKHKKEIGILVLIIVLVLGGYLTIIRNQVWLSRKSLYLSKVKDAPQSIQGHINMGKIYLEEKNIVGAVREANLANGIYDSHAPALNLMADIAIRGRDYKGAEKLLTKSHSVNPGLLETDILYAILLAKQGQYEQSLEGGLNLLMDYPNEPGVKFIVAVNYYKLGKVEQAKKYFEDTELLKKF